MNARSIKRLLLASAAALTVASCGGGGGGGGGGSSILYYPYENVYGDVCATWTPTPGCTFDAVTGLRIDVNESVDSVSNMWTVRFDSTGTFADVWDEWGIYQGVYLTSEFAGWQGGNKIGVGTTGLFWENVSGGRYLWDSNGVLYNDNLFESNYLKAINNKSAGEAVDTDIVAMANESEARLVEAAANNLVKKYSFTKEKAHAVASGLHRWGSDVIKNRGWSTAEDLKSGLEATFGVDYGQAVAAVKDLMEGKPEGMQILTERSAAALGLKPSDAKQFIIDSYEGALADFGYSAADLNW